MRTLALVLSLSSLPLVPASVSASTNGDAPPVTDTTREPEVVGGRQAPVGKWNDTAAVMVSDGYSACTGTLIAPNVVITAGHCIGIGIESVKLGVNDWMSSGGEEIPVMREVEYPNSQSTYDVGLLILARDSMYPPRVIASGCVTERSLKDGAPVHIVGYGAINEEGDQYTSEMREAESTIVDADCSGGRGCNGSVYPGGEVAAGGGGIDACFGDSGGPLYLDDPSGILLVGVTSRGFYDADLPCSEGGIWVRPDAVMDWIESTAQITLPRATCNNAPTATADSTELEVASGEIVSATIEVTDADQNDTHTFATGTPAMHGDVATDEDGSVHYRAREDYLGPDSFTVVVSDTGVPAMTTTVSFTVNVVESTGDGGCGCRTGGEGAPGTAVLVGLALLIPLRRRRRR
jgi:MYXO-CTERM domain-containing protein